MHRSPSPGVIRAGLFAVLVGGLSFAFGQSDIAGPAQPALEASRTSTMRIVYAKDDLSRVKETLSSLVYLGTGKVSAPIKHFSRYAVHY